MDKTRMLELDELDLRLARELELDARQGLRVLARKLAVSDTTIRKRMNRLLDEDIITIATVLNSRSLGFQTMLMKGLRVRPGKADEVAEYLSPNKSIHGINLTTGCYDILITVVLHDNREAASFLDEYLSHVPYLVSAETIMILDIMKMSWKYLNDDTEPYQQPKPRDLDELDLRLVRELELCPRENVSSLIKKLGLNRKLLNKRLQALLDDGVIRVVSIAKSWLFSYKLQVFIFVKVQPGKVGSVANSIITERKVHHIFIITGPHQILLNAAFRDIEEMSDFIRNQLGNYPGVVSHETLIIVKSVKLSFSLT